MTVRPEWAAIVECTCPCHLRVSDAPYCDACTDVDPSLCLRELRDVNKPPSKEGLDSHQVWVWMRPPGGIAHYEVRGTGAVWPDPGRHSST